MYFYRIKIALKEYHRILKVNDLEKEIDLRIANISTIIQTQIDIIIGLKRTTTRQVQYVTSTHDLHNSLKVTVDKFKHAFSGRVDKRRFPT